MSQLKAGIKKEIMLFVRTKRFIAIILVFILLAFIDTFSVTMLKTVANVYDDMLSGLSEQADVNIDFNMTETMEETLGTLSTTSDGLVQYIADVSSAGVVILVLFLIKVAGSEQKKRSTIIPNCAGLKPVNYVLPKFIIYPAFTLILVTLVTFVGYGFSLMFFETDTLSFISILSSGLLAGLFAAFMVAVHLCIGLSTGMPGISAIIIILGSNIVQIFLSGMNVLDVYNPYALIQLSRYTLYVNSDVNLPDTFTTLNMGVSLGMTFVLGALLYALTLFITSARKVDNSGSEPIL